VPVASRNSNTPTSIRGTPAIVTTVPPAVFRASAIDIGGLNAIVLSIEVVRAVPSIATCTTYCRARMHRRSSVVPSTI